MHDQDAPNQANKAEEVMTQTDDKQAETSATTQLDHPTYEELMVKLTEVEAKAQEHWNQLLRCQAELENLRRTRDRDVRNAYKYSSESTIKNFLSIADSYEKSLEQSTTFEQLREGVQQILTLVGSIFGKMGVTEVNPQGKPFDPYFHEAMAMEEHPTLAPNMVIRVLQKGYLLHDRVIRPALVVVAKAAEQNPISA